MELLYLYVRIAFMRRFLSISILLAAASVLSGCVQDLCGPTPCHYGSESDVPYSIKLSSSSETKTVNSGFSTEWAAGDRINVFHAESGSRDYVDDGQFILTQENLSDNLFTGALAQPLSSERYDWYFVYPYTENILFPVSCSMGHVTIGSRYGVPQVQKGNDDMSHIAGENYPLYAVLTDVPSDETPSGMMKHLSSLLAVNVHNETGTPMVVTSAGFKASEPLTGDFHIDVADEDVVFIPVDEASVSSYAALDVEDAEIKEGQSGKFYMAVKPFNAKSGSRITLCVNGAEKTLRLPEDVSFEAGKIKTLNVSVTPLVHPITTMPQLISMFDLDSTCRVDSGFVNGVPVDAFLLLGDASATGSVTLTGTVADFINMTEFGFFSSSWTGVRSALTIKKITIETTFLGYKADYTMTSEQFAEYVGLPSSVFVMRPYPAGRFDDSTRCHHLTILDEEKHYYGVTENEVDLLLSLYGVSVDGLRRLFKGEDNSYIVNLKNLVPEHLKAYFTEEMAEMIIPGFKESKISVELSTMSSDDAGNKTDPRVAIWGMNVYYTGD